MAKDLIIAIIFYIAVIVLSFVWFSWKVPVVIILLTISLFYFFTVSFDLAAKVIDDYAKQKENKK